VSVIADEGGRNAERGSGRILLEKGGARNVPGRVTARLEGGPEAAGREARSVRLALDELLPENSIRTLPSAVGAMKESCFSAVSPVGGWNQWV
jgi:hypothetical protein